MMAPINEMEIADMNGPLTVLPNNWISIGGIHKASPKCRLWLKLQSPEYVTKSLRAGAKMIWSNIQSTYMKINMATTTRTIADLTICQRKTSR